MEEPTTITTEQARTLWLDCYSRGKDNTFGEWLQRQLQDPIQPVNEKNRPRLHPLLLSLLAFGALAVAVFLYFSFGHK